MKPILLEDYLGRMSVPVELIPDGVRENATELLVRVNALLVEVGLADPVVNSGWRTDSYNKLVPGAAPKSRHITGEAIDIADPDGWLDQLLHDDLEHTSFVLGSDEPVKSILERHGLYMEHPLATKGWCHLQSAPPRSQKRIFFP